MGILFFQVQQEAIAHVAQACFGSMLFQVQYVSFYAKVFRNEMAVTRGGSVRTLATRCVGQGEARPTFMVGLCTVW